MYTLSLFYIIAILIILKWGDSSKVLYSTLVIVFFITSFFSIFIVKLDQYTSPIKHIDDQNHTYYISKTNKLFVENRISGDITEFKQDISSKIKYTTRVKTPQIEFETKRQYLKIDDWNPFKVDYEIKTFVSNVTLPKDDLVKTLTQAKITNK